MSKQIWKFPCPPVNEFIINMPRGAEILTWQMQGENLCLWAKVDPQAPQETRSFKMFGTGQPFDDERLEYISTIQILGGSLIFHLFEVKPS